ATFTPSGLSIHYPDPAEHVLEPRTLRPRVDPLAALEELLTDVIRQAPTATGCVGVELSGGADSGNGALAVKAARFPEVYSFGLLVGGSTGTQQSERRQVLDEHGGFRDATSPAMQHPPFCTGGVRDLRRPHDPAGAFYQEAFDACASRQPPGGARSCSPAAVATRSTPTTPGHRPNCRHPNPYRGSESGQPEH